MDKTPGKEKRFASRFLATKTATADEVKATSSALNVASLYSEALQEIAVRKDNMTAALSAGVECVRDVDLVLTEGKVKVFENFPLPPTSIIQGSDTKKLAFLIKELQFYSFSTAELYERLVTSKAEIYSLRKSLKIISDHDKPVSRTGKITDLETDIMDEVLTDMLKK